MSELYEIRWRGETYHASDLTDERKARYCMALYGHMLENAKRFKSAKDYMEFDRKLTANPPEWTSLPSWDVLESFNTVWGKRQLMRTILGLDADAMPDAELDEMVASKEADAGSDLNRAMALIRESSDPKAQRGGPGSPRPTDASELTPPSATNPSA